MYFRLDLVANKAICLIAGRNAAMIDPVNDIAQKAATNRQSLHPFTIHIIIMYRVMLSQYSSMDVQLKELLFVESHLLDGSLIAMEKLEQFAKYIQDLHEMSREGIILEHYNERSIATITHLLTDLERLRRHYAESGRDQDGQSTSLEHVRDGLLCLQDYGHDQSRRLKNRKQRIQNLTTLVSFAVHHFFGLFRRPLWDVPSEHQYGPSMKVILTDSTCLALQPHCKS